MYFHHYLFDSLFKGFSFVIVPELNANCSRSKSGVFNARPRSGRFYKGEALVNSKLKIDNHFFIVINVKSWLELAISSAFVTPSTQRQKYLGHFLLKKSSWTTNKFSFTTFRWGTFGGWDRRRWDRGRKWWFTLTNCLWITNWSWRRVVHRGKLVRRDWCARRDRCAGTLAKQSRLVFRWLFKRVD